MLPFMPSPALLQAIDRLNQAIDRSETALDQALSRVRHGIERRDTVIAEAMREIDDLISAMREDRHG